MGPWQHVTTGTGVNISALELEWFDTWLLGEHTPLSTTTTPLHLDIQNSGGSWVDGAQWPVPAATPTSYYFEAGRSGSDALSPNDGVLSPQAPTRWRAPTRWPGRGRRARVTFRRTNGARGRSRSASSPWTPMIPVTSTT